MDPQYNQRDVSRDSMENLKVTITTPNRITSPLIGVSSRMSNSKAKQRRNQLLKHGQYITAPLFWYYFRENLGILASLAVVIAFTVPWFTPTIIDINEFFLSGSILSIIGTSLVIISYYQVLPWRRHPSKLLLLRSITNLGFSVLIILNVSRVGKDGSASCDLLTFLNQFTVLASELWVFTIAVDLKRSITNPFSNYISNVKFYHYVVWILAVVNASALLSVRSCHKRSNEGFCWIDINEKSPNLNIRGCLWGFFLVWMIVCYVAAVLVIYFSHRKLTSGLESTYRAREAVINDTFRVVFLFLAYALFIVFLFLLSKYFDLQGMKEVLSFTIGCRGFYDNLVWFYLHDFKFMIEEDDEDQNNSGRENSLLSRLFSSQWLSSSRAPHKRNNRSSMQAPLLVSNMSDSMSSTIDGMRESNRSSLSPNVSRLMISDLDLTPQLNKELRKEVVSSVKEGIITSINNWASRVQSMQVGIQVGGGSFSSSHSQEHHTVDPERASRSPDRGQDDVTGLDGAARASVYQQQQQLVFGSGFHSVMYSFAGSILGHHGPGEYGEDYNARLSSFMEQSNTARHYHAIRTADQQQQQQHDASHRADAHTRQQNSPPNNKQPSLVGESEPYTPAEVVFDLDDKHRFRDFRPATFQTLRLLASITDEWYVQQLMQPAKEQLTEGASDAFLFYSGGLIVKTVTQSEARVLLTILDDYREHLRLNADSLLVRFFGLHALTFYGKEFIFVVMKNFFPIDGTVINERFDIKGSWVNRSAQLPPPGKQKICRHCSALFTVGSTDKCPEIVGLHEANIVFKDNDLSKKIRLKPNQAFGVLEALNKDSDALCRMGIMDYSLLIGVKNATYDVEHLLSNPTNSNCNYAPNFGSSNHYSTISSNCNSGRAYSSSAVSSTLTTRLMKGSISSNSNNFAGEALANQEIITHGVSFSMPNGSDQPAVSSLVDPTTASGDYQTSNGEDPTLSSTSALAQTANAASADSNITGFSARAVVAPSTYYLGVVDILQTWSLSKRVENFTKVNLKFQNADGISCVPPEQYKRRFQRKIHQIFDHSMFLREVTGSWKGNRVVSDPSPIVQSPGYFE